MSTPASGAPTIPNPAAMFDIVDPPHDYQILVPDPVVPAAAVPPVAPAPAPAPVATVATPAPIAAPSAPSAPSAPTAPTAPTAPKHPDWLVRAAEGQGMHPLILERLDTNDLNAIVVSTMQRQLQERNTAIATQTIQAPPQVQPPNSQPGTPPLVPQPAVPIQQAPAHPQQPAFDWGVHPDIDDRTGLPTAPRQYTDADINPAIGAHIKALATEVTNLKRFISTMNQTVAQSTEEKIQREFDTEFQKYPQVFGQGDGRAVHGKPEFERRRIVYQSVKAMFQTLPPEARTAVTIGGAVQNYTKTLFGADPATVAAPAPVGAPGSPVQPGANFAGAGLAVPTQRKPAPAGPGRDQAIEATLDWWNQNKAANPADAGGGTSLNEFL